MNKMKCFRVSIFCFAALISTCGFSQKSILNKLWVGKNNEYIKADSTVIRFETFSKKFGNTRTSRFYTINGDTLKLVDSNSDESGLASNFLLNLIGIDQMTLTPINSGAQQLTNLITLDGIKRILTYKEIHQFPCDSLQFKKIAFSTTECYGRCPVMSLEINNKKQLRFIGEKYTSKTGFYSGHISDEQLNAITEILRYSQLDLIECNSDKNIDLSTYTVEVSYNGKTRTFKTCMLPFVLDDLKDYLLDLPRKVDLIESKDKFEIKFDSPLK